MISLKMCCSCSYQWFDIMIYMDTILCKTMGCHISWSFIYLSSTTVDVWMIPSFQMWGYMLHVEHISCVITNCGQHQGVIPSPFSIALKPGWRKTLLENYFPIFFYLFCNILLFQVTFLICFFIAIFSPYFLLFGLVLQYVALFQSGN